MSDFLSQIKELSRDRLALLASELKQKLDQCEAARRGQSPGEGAIELPASARQPHYDRSRCPALSTRYADFLALDSGDPATLELVFDDAARRSIAEAQRRTGWGRDVLVLGANGFVGAHMVHRLLLDKRVHRVRALARSRAGSSARDRIFRTWATYQLQESEVDLGKLEVIDGSPTRRYFGLSRDLYATLARDVDTVFDCVGTIDYVRPYLDLRNDWVLELLGVLQFCLDRRVKQLTYLGSIIANLYETREGFERPDTAWGSGYAQVKWVNHALVKSAARHGMRALLCEAPHVLGSTTVGKDPGFQYGFWRVFKLADALRMTWEGPVPDFSPVDILAGVAVENALSDEPLPVVRPTAPWRANNAEVAAALGWRVVPWPEFVREVSKYATATELHILGDAPDVIRRTNGQPIYPPNFDLGRFPTPDRLAELYLSQLDPKWAAQRGAGT